MRFHVIPPVNRSTGSNLMVNVCPAKDLTEQHTNLSQLTKQDFDISKPFCY